jgi:hypothetical protein
VSLTGILLFAAQAVVANPQPAPDVLLRSVCLQDQVSLPANEFQDVAYSELPNEARVAFNRVVPGFIPARMVREISSPLGAAQVPNRVLAQQGGNGLFLILPRPDASGLAAHTCAVAWKGKLADVGSFIKETFLRVGATPGASLTGRVQLLRTTAGGAELTAAEYSGWSVIAVTPESVGIGQKG